MGNALSKIFPPYLTLVVNYPLLLGALLNISLVSPRLVTINLLYQTFFVIIYRSLKSTVLYRAGLVLYGLMSLSESLHWTILKGPLTLSSLLAISATHLQESIDFWGLKASLGPLLVLPLLFLLHKAWKHRPDFSPLPHSPLVQSLLALVFIGFIWENAHAGRLVRKGVPHFIKVAITFQQEMELFRHAKEKGTIQPTEARATAKEQTVVLVIGESSNRNHWQLYGCAWPTTPRLSARHDLYVFNNVVSAHSSTIPSVLSSLRGNTPENARPAEVRDLFDVFGSAGYTTYWISNQWCPGKG